MVYYGGKDGAGVAQRLINQIPPHRVFVSAFLGDCAVLRRIRPAELTIGKRMKALTIHQPFAHLIMTS
jgi:DNA adenine methylase